MTISVGSPIGYGVTVIGGSFQYGIVPVTDGTTGKTLGFPAHFAMNAAGALINPITEETGQAIVASLQALAAQLANQATLVGGVFLPAPATLPTALPSTSGVYWNDGGLLAIS